MVDPLPVKVRSDRRRCPKSTTAVSLGSDTHVDREPRKATMRGWEVKRQAYFHAFPAGSAVALPLLSGRLAK